MATERPKAGLVETTITTGTGAYALLGGMTPPWRGFVAADDGKVWSIGVYQDGVGFEEGEYTYNHGARTLARTTVSSNHLGTSAPVDWGAGTKEVSNVISSARVMMTTVENKVFADQYMQAFKLILDTGFTSWISAATNNIIRLFTTSSETVKIEDNRLTLTYQNDTATEGPEIAIDRATATPAANDAVGVIRMTGRDTNQNTITVCKMRPTIISATPGSHSSRFAFDISKAGALQPNFEIRPDVFSVLTGVSLFTVSKTSTNLNTVGAELLSTGEVNGVAQDDAAANFYRKGTDGLVIAIGKDGVEQGGIQCISGTVSIAGSSMTHESDWAPDVQDGQAFEDLGWVVCSAEGLLEDEAFRHPLVRPSQESSDPCVYGVVAGRHDGKLWIEAAGSGLIRCVGPVARGDLLETSDTEGCAQAQAGAAITSSTVAKATQSSEDTGPRLVPCTLLAG